MPLPGYTSPTPSVNIDFSPAGIQSLPYKIISMFHIVKVERLFVATYYLSNSGIII